MSSQHPTIFPCLSYVDPDAALRFLTRAFGFEEHAVYRDDAGAIVHAEMVTPDRGGMIMFGVEKKDGPFAGKFHTLTYIVVADIEAHHARARAAGAEIVAPLADKEYGSRDYAARDPEGNVWSFGTYQPFASPSGS
jgi:uncharacterized glyoxalase superfamily protein PhnB